MPLGRGAGSADAVTVRSRARSVQLFTKHLVLETGSRKAPHWRSLARLTDMFESTQKERLIGEK